MYKIVSYFASIEVVGLLGFIFASRYQEGGEYRYLPLLVALTAIVYVAYLKARVISYKEIAYVSIMVSVTVVFVVQLLGFTVYSGLVKDIIFFSGENAARIGLMLLIGTVGHFLLLTLTRLFYKNRLKMGG
jgi:hypothetical protein